MDGYPIEGKTNHGTKRIILPCRECIYPWVAYLDEGEIVGHRERFPEHLF